MRKIKRISKMDSVVGTGLFNLIRKAANDYDLVEVKKFLEENPKYQNWKNIKNLKVINFEDSETPHICRFKYIHEYTYSKQILSEIYFKYNWPYPIVKELHYFIEDPDFDFFKEVWKRNSLEFNYVNTSKILKHLLMWSSPYKDDIQRFLDFFPLQGMNLNISNDQGEAVILGLIKFCPYYIVFLPDLVKRGLNPTTIGKTSKNDLIDVVNDIPSSTHRNKNKSDNLLKLKQIFNQWEAKKFVHLKTECTKVFSLLLTKKIIQYSIHRKADLEEVWNFMIIDNFEVNRF